MDELRGVRMRILGMAGALLAVLAAGTAGYRLIEGWGLFDSLYMTVITLATVGYGETHPLSPAGRVFTIFLILGGIGVVTYVFSTVTAAIVEGELSQAFRRRGMQKEIDRLSGHYIVCGGGHSGWVICRELMKTGRAFVLVERREEAIAKVNEKLGGFSCLAVAGDATEDEILKKAGVERASGIFAALRNDQDNAFVALSAKGLNPKLRVVSRQLELGSREKLLRSGADQVVNPEFIGGLRMASEMIRPAAVGFLDSMIRDRDSVVRFEELSVPEGSPLAGRTAGSVKGADGNAPLLVAVWDPSTGKYEINPLASRVLKAGDKLVMIGEMSRLAEMRRSLGPKS